MFIAAALAICVGIFNILFNPSFFYGGYYWGRYEIISLILGILFYVGLLLSLFGFYGFYKNYGSSMGIAAFGFGIIATTFFLISQIISAIAYSSYNYPYYSPSVWAIIFTIISMVLLGVLFILEGVSFMTARHFSNIGELNLTAGIILVISGSFFCSLFLGILGGYFLFASVAIIAGIIFVKSPIPVLVADRIQFQATKISRRTPGEILEEVTEEAAEENPYKTDEEIPTNS